MKQNLCEKIYLYGLDENYNVVWYTKVCNTFLKVENLIDSAIRLKQRNLAIRTVFAIDECDDMKEAYRDAMRRGWMEDRVVFKVLLEQRGIKVIG